MATTEADIQAPISETCRAEKGTEMLTEATNVVLDKPAGEAEPLSEKHLDTVRKHLEGEDRKEAIEGNIGTIEAENICESPSVANVALEHQLSLSGHNVTAEVLNETESKFSESSVGKEAEDNPAEIVSTIKVNSAEEIQQISEETLSSCDKELNGKIAPEDNADLHEAKSSRSAEGEVHVPDLAKEVKVENVKEACNTYDITEKIPTIEPASSIEDVPKTTFSKEGLHDRISESGDEKEEVMPSKSQGTNTDLEEMTSPTDMKDEDTNKETIVRDATVNVTSKSENPSDQNEEAKEIGEKANEHVTEETFLSEVGSNDIHSEEIRSSDHLADEHVTEAETSSDGNAHSSITNRSLSENEQNGKEEIGSIKNELLNSSLIADVGSNKDGNLEDDTNSTIEVKSQEAGELSKNLSSEECKIQSTDKPGYSGTESKDVPFQKVDRPLSSSTVVPENVSCSQNVTKETDTEPNSKVDLASTEASTGEYKDEERSTISYEVHTKVEEHSKFKDDENLLPHSETLQMNPEEHLYAAPDENDVSASCQATPSEKQRSNANLPEVAKEGRMDETIDADYTEEKQTSDGKNISTPDLNEEEDVNILCSTAKDLKSTLPLVEETKQEQVCEETQIPIKEPKDVHDAHEASNIPESSNFGQTLAEGASDVNVTSTSQTDADKLETEPKLNSTKRLQINVEKNTEDNLQQHGEASEEQDHETPKPIENTIHGSETTFDASSVTSSEEACLHKEESSTPELRFESPSEMQDESRIEAKEKEYIAEETSEVQPQQSVHEIQLSDSQSVENDKSVETGEENTLTDDHSLSSESSKKDVSDLAISHSKDREILPAKVDKENIEASHVESEKSEKTLESVTQVRYSELPYEVEQCGTKEESLEAATTETGVEKIPNKGTNEAKESTKSYVSSEKITEEDSHFDPTEKEIIQEEVPSIMIHVISETTKSGNKNEVARDQEGTDEDGVVKGLHEDSTADNRLNRSLGEKEKTEYTHGEPKELNPQEDFHELDCGHTKTEVKSSTEEVLSSEVVFLQHDKDRGVEDQEYSVEKKSEAQTVNINDSFVADIAGVKEVTENIVLEAKHEGLLHESTKDSEINEKSSTAVEKNKEVVIAADNNILESLLDHGKLDIRPVETACEENEDSRGFSPEKKEDKEDEPGAFEENSNIQKDEHEEQHSVIGTEPTEDDSRANDEGSNEKEKNEDQATVATRGVETKQEEADSQSSITEGEDRKIHCPDVKLESLSPLAESSTEICHIDEPLDLAKPTDIAPDIIEPNKAPLALKEKDIPEEPLPSESTEVKIPSAAIDPQLLQNDPTVTIVRDEIQKLEIENYPNAAEEAAKVEFEGNGESDKPKEMEQESISIKPAKNSESDLIQGSANETISVAEEMNQLAEDHVLECVKDSNMGIEQKENQVELSGNKNIGAEINDNSSLSVSGNNIPVPKDPEESSEPVISSGDEAIPQLQLVSVTVEREIEELEQANASVDEAEAKRVECGDGTRSGKCGEDKGTIHDDNQIPESSQEEEAIENFQTGGEIPRSVESSHEEAKSEEQRISAEIKEAIENSLPTEIANTPASEEENLQTAEHLSERSRLTANNEEVQTENAEKAEDKEVITNGAKDEEEEEEVQRGEKSGSEVPHIIEKDPEDLTSNKCTVAEMKEDSSIAIPDKKILVRGDSDESTETAISSEYKDQPVSVIGHVELEIDELKHADASEATRSNKDEEAKENNEDQATITTRGSETERDVAEGQSNIAEGEDQKIHDPDIKLENSCPPEKSSTDICRVDEPLDVSKPTEIAAQNEVSLSTKEMGIPEEPQSNESTVVTIISAGRDVQLLQKDPAVIAVQAEIQKPTTEDDPNAAPSCAEPSYEKAKSEEKQRLTDEIEAATRNSLPTETPNASAFDEETLKQAEDLSEKNKLIAKEEELETKNAEIVEVKEMKTNEAKDEEEEGEVRRGENSGFEVPLEVEKNPVDCRSNKITAAIEIKEDSSNVVPDQKIPVQGDPEKSIETVISSEDKDIQPVTVTRTMELDIDKLKHINASEAPESNNDEEAKEKNEDQATVATNGSETGRDEVPLMVEKDPVDSKSNNTITATEIKEESSNVIPDKKVAEQGDPEESIETVISSEDKDIQPVLVTRTIELEIDDLKHVNASEAPGSNKDEEAKEKNEDQAIVATNESETERDEVLLMVEKDPDDSKSNKTIAATEIKEESSNVIPDKKVAEQRDPGESIETVISSEDKEIQPALVTRTVELEIDELKHIDASEAPESNKDEESKEKNEDQARVATNESETERDEVPLMVEKDLDDSKSNKTIAATEIKEESSNVVPYKKVAEQRDPGESIETVISNEDKEIQPVSVTRTMELEIDELKHIDASEAPKSNKDEESKEKNEDQARVATNESETEQDEVPLMVEKDPDDSKSNKTIAATEIKEESSNVVPDKKVAKQRDPGKSIETVISSEDKEIQPVLVTRTMELEIDELKHIDVSEAPESNKDEESKENNEDQATVATNENETERDEVPLMVEKDPDDSKSNKTIAATEIKEESSNVVPDKKVAEQRDPGESIETVISSEDKEIQPVLVTRTMELEIDELKHIDASEAPESNKDEESKEKNEDQATVATNESETEQDEVPLMVEKDPDNNKSNKTIAETEIKEESSNDVPDKKVAEQRDQGESIETVISSEDKEIQPVLVTRTMELEIDELKHIDASEAPESNKDEESKEKNEDQATVATNESETERDEVPLMVEKDPDDSKSNKTIAATEIKEESSNVIPDKKVAEQRDPGESIETVISSEDKEIQPVLVTRTMELEIDELKHIDASEAPESNKDEESKEKNEDQARVATNESETGRDEVPLMVEKDPDDSKSNKTIAATETKEESSSVVPDKKVAEQRDLGESIETVISSEDKEIQPISVTRTMELEIDELKHIDVSEAPESNKDEESKEKNEDQARVATVATVGSETGRDEASAQSMAQGDDEKIHDADTKLESSFPYEKSSTDICHIDEPLDISESAEVAPDIIVQNEVSLSTKEIGIPEEPQSSKSTVVTVTSVDGDFELLQKDPAITAVQDEIQKPKTENDPNAAPSCAEPSSEKAKGEEEQRLTDEIEETTKTFQPTETANTTTFGEETLPIAENSSEKSKLILTEEELQTENAKKDEDKEVKTNEAQYEEEEGEVQRRENSGSKVPPIVETGTVDGTKDEIISPIEMKEDSSSVVADKKITVQEDPEESIETVISSEDKDIQPVSVTGTIKLETEELKHVDASEAAGSNNDEESKEKNEDQPTVATRASETERDEADSHSSITEGEDPKLHDPDVKLENLSPPEESSKDICYSDEHLDREKPTEIAQDIIEVNKVSLALKEMVIPEEPPSSESTEFTITSADKDVQLPQKDPALTAVQDEIQKVKTENDSNAASEAAAVESEAKGAADEFKEMEQESTSTKPVMSSESDLTQGSANHTLSVADERETPDQLAEDHIYNHEKNSNIGIAQKEEQVDLSSNKTESSEPMISSGEEDIPRLQPVSVTVESEIEEKRVNASEAVAEAERVEYGDNATAGECGEEKGTIDGNNQIPESSKSMESTKSAPTDFLQRCAKETIQEAEDINSMDQHEDLNVIQHVQDSPIRTVQEGGVNDIGVTQKTEELEAAPLLSSHKDRELEADPGTVVDLKNSTGDKNVSQIQEEEAAEKFQAGGEIPICAEPSHEEVKSEEEQRITDETKEATGKSLPTETVNTSASEEETLKIAEAENAERVEDKGLKTDEAKEEEEEGDVQRGENSGSEVPLMVEKDQVDLKSNEIITAETKDDSSSVVSDEKIPLQEDPEESIKTVISSEHKDIQPLSVTGTVELEKEELKHVNASETAAEANSVECGGEKRTSDEPKEIPECSTLMVSAKSSPSDLGQASGKETTGKAEDIESQDRESLHVPTKDGVDDIDGNQDKQKPETALQLAPEEHVVLEADQKVIPRPENSQEVPQLQQQAAADAGYPEPGRETAKSKEEQRLIDETEKEMSMSLPTEALEIAAQQSKEESKLVSEKDELQAENAEKAEDAAVKTDEEEEAEEHKDENSGSEAPVIVEASRDVDVKVSTKKSHGILSGVGSKVKHSIAKVKKAITGKHSHTKPPSPKARE